MEINQNRVLFYCNYELTTNYKVGWNITQVIVQF